MVWLTFNYMYQDGLFQYLIIWVEAGQHITRTWPQHYCYNNSYSPDIPTIYNNISHVTFLLFAYVDNYWFMLLLYFLSNNTHIGPDAQRLRQGTGQTDLEVMFDNKVVANFSYCY